MDVHLYTIGDIQSESILFKNTETRTHAWNFELLLTITNGSDTRAPKRDLSTTLHMFQSRFDIRYRDDVSVLRVPCKSSMLL